MTIKNWKTKNCTIYQILKGRSNSFLIKCENNYALVDTGRKNSWKELKDKLDNILDENKLSCLILTHTHFDHVENAARLKKEYKCNIIVHESEADYLKHGDNPLLQGIYPITRFMVNLLEKRLQSHYKYEPAEPDILVDEKCDLRNFGFNVYILHTPGHSKGSISVIVDNEIALVGDTLHGAFPNSAFPPFAEDSQVMVQSWTKFFKTDCRLFLPGHGSEISRKLLQKQYEKHKKGLK